jgi:hypothetical protein
MLQETQRQSAKDSEWKNRFQQFADARNTD